MALVKWNPWVELDAFNQHLEHLFSRDIAMSKGKDSGNHNAWMPSMDIMETDRAYVVEADLPGLTIEDIDVQVEANKLRIAGERKAEQHGQQGHYTYSERTHGKFQRVFTLPEAVNVDSVEAKYANGVLTVSVPKSEDAQPKRIAIQAS
jgi:HSP20 family protein